MCVCDNEKKQRERLKQQLIESHAKVVYTYTDHHKMADSILQIDKGVRVTQIILTAISTGGFIANIITNQTVSCLVAGVSAALSLALNLYTKDFKLQADARVHKDAADDLWDIREGYTSLITDMDMLSIESIVNRRNALQNDISIVNRKYSGTNRRGYKKAKKALRKEEEQTFNVGEAEMLLPTNMRDNH